MKFKRSVAAVMAAAIMATGVPSAAPPLMTTTAYAANTSVSNQLSTPKLSQIGNTSSGVNVKWKSVSGAKKYRVFRKVGSGRWQKVADTTSTAYTDKSAKNGTTYTYTVRCISSDGKKYTSSYNKTGLTIKRLAQPTPRLSNTSSGAKVSWDKVIGATKYRVYYKNGNSWVKLEDTTSTNYTDKSVKDGASRTYTVKAFSGRYMSSYHSGVTIKRLAQPDFTLSNNSTGVKISWDKVTGATKYRVYYKNGNSWVKLDDTTSANYTDKSVKDGASRTYTVKAFSGSYMSSYHSGVTIKRLAQPDFTLSNDSTGVKISWGKVTGATKYRVYYKNGTSWTKLTDTTSTSYIDKSVKNGTSRTYTVKAFSGDYTSSYHSGKSITYEVAVEHTHEYVSEVTTEPTCGKAGVRTYTCTCGHSYTESIPATGKHNYIAKVTKEANCKEDGVKTYTCSVCGDSYTEPIPSTGEHNYASKVTKEPTCKDEGVVTYTCEGCGDSYTEPIPVTDEHHYTTKITKEATCGEDGVKTNTCSVCGDSFDKIIPSTGAHEYSYEVTKEPTCAETGMRIYTCKGCDDSYTEVIPATGNHHYTSEVTREATCTVTGVKKYTCEECGTFYTEDIPATGEHKYSSKVTKEPTCTDVGVRTYTCEVCGDSYVEKVEALGHDMKETTEQVYVVDEEAYDEQVKIGIRRGYSCHGCYDEASAHYCDMKAYIDDGQTLGAPEGTYVYSSFDEFYNATKEVYGSYSMSIAAIEAVTGGSHSIWFKTADDAAAAASQHSADCETGNASYGTFRENVYETVHHDEVGHYETVTHRVCNRCGVEE